MFFMGIMFFNNFSDSTGFGVFFINFWYCTASSTRKCQCPV